MLKLVKHSSNKKTGSIAVTFAPVLIRALVPVPHVARLILKKKHRLKLSARHTLQPYVKPYLKAARLGPTPILKT
jgi:hypothetical protein